LTFQSCVMNYRHFLREYSSMLICTISFLVFFLLVLLFGSL